MLPRIVEILQLSTKSQTSMVPRSRFIIDHQNSVTTVKLYQARPGGLVTEAVTRVGLQTEVFLKISQISQEIICVGVSF